MDYRHLGRTGLRVSPLCLGTMNFGPLTEKTVLATKLYGGMGPWPNNSPGSLGSSC